LLPDQATGLLRNEADGAIAQLVLAHGAGAPMDHPWMNQMTALLVARGIRVVRFEFGFMAARRDDGKRRPARKAEHLVGEYSTAVKQLCGQTNDGLPTLIGGKSLGGRVASLVADELYAANLIDGVVCFGYPFHPAKKPTVLRTAHLAHLACPALIVQGTRDPLGAREEVADYALAESIDIVWLEDGDHDLKPRKASGETFAGHMETAAAAVERFSRRFVEISNRP